MTAIMKIVKVQHFMSITIYKHFLQFIIYSGLFLYNDVPGFTQMWGISSEGGGMCMWDCWQFTEVTIEACVLGGGICTSGEYTSAYVWWGGVCVCVSREKEYK